MDQKLFYREFAIYWATQDDLILVTDNDQLEEIYLMMSIHKDNRIPRFNILMNSEEAVISEQNAYQTLSPDISNGDAYQKQFIRKDSILAESYYPSQSEIQNMREQVNCMSQEFRNLNDIQEQTSLVLDYQSSDDSSDSEKEDFLMLESFKNHCRNQIDKESRSLFAEVPVLVYSHDPSDNEESEEEKENHKIENSQQIDISVCVTQNQFIDKEQMKKNIPLLSTFKNFFKKKVLPANKTQFSIILGQNEQVHTAKAGSACALKWTVQNQADVNWPKGVQLVLIYSQPIALINNQSINRILKPQETQDIIVNIFIPHDIKEQHQIVMFRLKDKDGFFIGQPLLAFIRILLEESEQNVLKERERNTEDLTQFKLSDEQYLGMASLLFDEGYGNFDRCNYMVKTLRGDIKKAREFLSQLIFYECQY